MPIKTAFFVDFVTILQELQKCYTNSKSILMDIVTCIDSHRKDSSLTSKWIPSHIGQERNEIVNKLAKVAAVLKADIDCDLF